MRTILLALLLLTSTQSHGSDPLDLIGMALTQGDPEEHLDPWERNLTQNDWKQILEDCYKRKVSPESFNRLENLLQENGGFQSQDQDSKEIQIRSYCVHAFTNGKRQGLSLEVIPLGEPDLPTKNHETGAKHCWNISENGFSEFLKKHIAMFANAKRSLQGKEKGSALSAEEAAMNYILFCSVMTTKRDEDNEVLLRFNQ